MTASLQKMQSETADFAAGAAIWQTGRNIASFLILTHSLHYKKTQFTRFSIDT